MARYIDVEPFLEHRQIENWRGDAVGTSDYVHISELKNAPVADVTPVVHSHWIHTGEYLTNSDGERLRKLSDLYVCHRCHRVEEVPEPYCNCGAKMDEEMEEDDYED